MLLQFTEAGQGGGSAENGEAGERRLLFCVFLEPSCSGGSWPSQSSSKPELFEVFPEEALGGCSLCKDVLALGTKEINSGFS